MGDGRSKLGDGKWELGEEQLGWHSYYKSLVIQLMSDIYGMEI